MNYFLQSSVLFKSEVYPSSVGGAMAFLREGGKMVIFPMGFQ